MDREEALDAIRANVENENLVKHMLAAEAIMRALAKHLGEDEEVWGLTGLWHDIDVELTRGDMKTHSKLGADMARDLGASPEITHAILCHNGVHGAPFENRLDRAMYCADPLTGLITAVALVYPGKKIAGVETDSVLRRFRQPKFAAGANREQIMVCRELGLELDQFVKIGLEAMQSVAEELGL